MLTTVNQFSSVQSALPPRFMGQCILAQRARLPRKWHIFVFSKQIWDRTKQNQSSVSWIPGAAKNIPFWSTINQWSFWLISALITSYRGRQAKSLLTAITCHSFSTETNSTLLPWSCFFGHFLRNYFLRDINSILRAGAGSLPATFVYSSPCSNQI